MKTGKRRLLTAGLIMLFLLSSAVWPMGKEISAEEPSTSSLRPSDYSFEIRYIDGNGRPVPGNVVIQFEKAGNYSSEELPLPLGYQKLIPAHPGESWLYPTSLEFIHGEWRVTEPVVSVMVEKMASVRIKFQENEKQPMENLSYTAYFSEEGIAEEQVVIPYGYKTDEALSYQVNVFRNQEGRLEASPNELVYQLKRAEEQQPEENVQPDTGSKGLLAIAIGVLAVSFGVLAFVFQNGENGKG